MAIWQKLRARATILMAALFLAAPAPTSAQVSSKPNIVLIMVDDLGKEGLGTHYRNTYNTPNIDRLSNGGVRFSRFYTTPMCSPTRATLLSGLYPGRHDVITVNSLNKGACLDASLGNFASVLKAEGYATALAGKWHVCDAGNLTHPGESGFDQWLITAGSHWSGEIQINGVPQPVDASAYNPDVATDFALEFMRTAGQPFLLYFPTKLVHKPWERTPGSNKSWRKGDPRWFPKMVEYMDSLIGKILDELEFLGIADNTVVFFLSDNGTVLELGTGGAKKTTLDAGINNPFIVYWPGVLAGGTINHELVDLTDLYPTILDLAGASLPTRAFVDDGFSLVPHLTAGEPWPRSWAYSRRGSQWALIQGEMKLTERGLFNLSTDPLETKPLSKPGRTRKMEAVLLDAGLFPFE